MKGKIFFFCLIGFLLQIGCTQTSNSADEYEKLFQVIINGEFGQKIYYLDTNNKIRQSEFIDLAGNVTARTYNYDNNGELQSINKTSSVGEKSEIYFSYEYSRGDGQISKKIVSHTTSRGTEQRIESIFERDENNNVTKIISTDENANTRIKKLKHFGG
jgi:hypothetical protein